MQSGWGRALGIERLDDSKMRSESHRYCRRNRASFAAWERAGKHCWRKIVSVGHSPLRRYQRTRNRVCVRRAQNRLLAQVVLSASIAYAGDLEAHLNKADCWWPTRPWLLGEVEKLRISRRGGEGRRGMRLVSVRTNGGQMQVGYVVFFPINSINWQ